MRMPLGRFIAPVLALAIASTTHLGVEAWRNARATDAPDVQGFASLSFAPNQRHANPEAGDAPTREQIAADLRTVRTVSGRVRTYTVSQNLDLVPELAAAEGMRVSLGIWVDGHDPARTRREFDTAAVLARTSSSVDTVFVGNEAILRNDATPTSLAAMMREFRSATGGRVTVTTGETWDIWLKHPELAEAADVIGAHILPYWENVPADRAVEVAFQRYERLRAAFPGKRIVIAEFGWPSAKFNRGAAVASPLNQATVVRAFVAEAARRGVDYNLVEAFDQPWKVNEGDVGPYWGVFDAHRAPKYALSGQVARDPLWFGKALGGAALGVAMSAWFLFRRRVGPAEALATAAVGQTVGFAAARVFSVPLEQYASLGLAASWLLSVPLLLLLGLVAFDRMREMAEVLLGHAPRRLIPPSGASDPDRREHAPMVSIHVPACGENPAVVIQTLESMACLDYPAFEVLAVVNNTTRPELVEPVREACARLGSRFRFIHLPKIEGFKAGALNRALAATSPEAEIVALVDADYTVEREWLRDLAPVFVDPRVGLVQAPQEHRDEAESWLKRSWNAEYAGFFDVGMVQRNEDDAIIAHGTMLMVRRSALEAVGGWGERYICEDTELGLRLVEAGWTTHYTRRRYGAGLLPDTFRAFRRQRDRWAYGAMRIMLGHWRHMLPSSRTLTSAQKYHFCVGWLHWVADAAAVALAAANLGYVSFMLATGLGEPPPAVVTVSIALAATASLAHMFALYTIRVRRGAGSALLAAVAGVALQMTVARAVFRGLVLANLPFHVTAKGGRPTAGWRQLARDLRWEAVLGAGLATAAVATAIGNTERVFEFDAFAAVLAIQAIPFLTAIGVGVAEATGVAVAERRTRRAAAARIPPQGGILAAAE